MHGEIIFRVTLYVRIQRVRDKNPIIILEIRKDTKS